ncbi:Polysaccharide polymerase [Vibrio crassostreae]|nr:Polysaccharide polymerase [Vibrio crassostreae]
MRKVFSSYFLMIFFFPLIPMVMGNSQIHINVITLVCSILFLAKFRNKIAYNSFYILAIYFFFMQVFLFGSVWSAISHEELSSSSILSVLRPTLLFLLYVSTLEICRRYEFYTTPEFKFLIVISFIYVILEVFFLQYSQSFITFFYKRDFRPELFFVGTTFFGTSYYSAYSFYCIYLLSFVSLYNNRRLIDKVVLSMAFCLVVLSLSKTMIFSLLISSYLMLLVYVRIKLVRFFLFFIPLLFTFILFYYQAEISEMLSDAGVPALSSIKTLLYDSSNSGSVITRSQQIIDSFELSQSHSAIFGAGLGQSASIESLPAVFLYRYGLIGLIFFYIVNLVLFIFSVYKLVQGGKENFAIYFALSLWLITLPITQLSGVMIEQSKMAFISAIMLGYLFKSNVKRV